MLAAAEMDKAADWRVKVGSDTSKRSMRRTIFDRLKAKLIREQAGMSRNDVVKAAARLQLDIHANTIYKIESGKTKHPTAEHLHVLATVYRCQIDDFFTLPQSAMRRLEASMVVR